MKSEMEEEGAMSEKKTNRLEVENASINVL